jgi:hypothetical protein
MTDVLERVKTYGKDQSIDAIEDYTVAKHVMRKI